ncbi:MAG: MFS transporter, partial [Mycobacteriaceae bacterium]
LVMGATYNAVDHRYTIGLVLLSIVAIIACAYTLFGIRSRTEASA